MLASDLDLGDVSVDSVEQFAETGGLLPPGKYHVRLERVTNRQSQMGGTGAECEYTVVAGPFAGATVKDTLWAPDAANQRPDQVKKTRDRFVLFGLRLGMFRSGPNGKVVTVKQELGECVGAEVVVEVTHRAGQKGGTFANVGYAGVWSLTDPKVRDVAAAHAAGAAGAGAGGRAARTPVDDL